jgi:membrane protein implicated in regulation of membrane protease activity
MSWWLFGVSRRMLKVRERKLSTPGREAVGIGEFEPSWTVDRVALSGHPPIRCGRMPAWLMWLCAAAVLGVVEMTTLTFAAGLMAAAAVVAAVVAGVGGGLVVQALTFAAASFAALAVAYPFASRRRVANSPHRSGVEALLDRPAVVVKQVDALAGEVRIGGEVWSARAYDETLVIPAGTRVAVFEIQGATALVYPKELP